MNGFLAVCDQKIISFCRLTYVSWARLAIFVVYGWFGILKIAGPSPANPLVESLLERTLPFVTFGQFIVVFGALEALLGIMFLWPKLDRLSIGLFGLHMITTIMPLFLLPAIAWQSWFVPTLEGQYMIKNIVLIALVIGIAAQEQPLGKQ